MPIAEIQSVSAACWACGASVAPGQSFCPSCGKVQPPASGVDYFAVFSLPRKLHLDTSALERAFYKLSRRLHPDVYAQASLDEQQWSLEQTSLLNDAYRTLKNPVTRTEYLLKLEGVEIEAGRSEGNAPKDSRIPPDLLEEVFELNMQLEEMRMAKKMGEDDPQTRADLEKARVQFEAQLAESDAQLAAQWTKWDAAQDAAGQQQAKDAMVAVLDRRRYLRNLVRDVHDVLEA
ncbi:Fe-S protein assembly co-chaperone HscB [Silvibacterium dinghuense]|uniref:Fe-S protein assembly co-chaperone HscB n=1 Tax=Silvibacterium dinghuense TaxID=1560006 RepID=A0A4Q1S8W8_9BACT|nr:Fe-S protein assembly co-chaperone HscB [Silvibacterium dinghuense]GGH04976.1 hypothetical protein GCM10011586_21350 [Silvibacterium dinghuense]